MELFLFLVCMANIMFVFGLFFSVQIKNMAALAPAFFSAALIFWGAYIKFYDLPYHFVTDYCLAVVGGGYLAWGIYYQIQSRVRPDKKSKARFLMFIGLMGLGACYFMNIQEWPLKFGQTDF